MRQGRRDVLQNAFILRLILILLCEFPWTPSFVGALLCRFNLPRLCGKIALTSLPNFWYITSFSWCYKRKRYEGSFMKGHNHLARISKSILRETECSKILTKKTTWNNFFPKVFFSHAWTTFSLSAIYQKGPISRFSIECPFDPLHIFWNEDM